MEEKYYELSSDIVETISSVLKDIAVFNINVKYIGSTKLKQLIKLQKVNDVISYTTNIDLIIIVNEDLYNRLEDNIIKILIHQELDRLEFDMMKDTFKIGKFKLQTNIGILKKYGIEQVAEANELIELTLSQMKDSEKTETEI